MDYHRIKLLRQQAHVSPQRVAKELEMSVENYMELEQGLREPFIDNLVSLSRLYNVPSDYIINLTDETTPYK